MELTYQLSVDDVVESQLYGSAHSDFHIKKRKRSRWLIALLYLALGIMMVYKHPNWTLGISSFAFAIVWYAFYPKYAKWRYKKYFQSMIKSKYSDLIGSDIYMGLDEKGLTSKDSATESAVKWKDIAQLIQLKDHFLVQLSTGQTLIVPMLALKDQQQELTEIFSQKQIEIVDDQNWKFV